MVYTLPPEIIEEAVMQYLVATEGANYDELTQSKFTLFNYDPKHDVQTVTDLKLARLEVRV